MTKIQTLLFLLGGVLMVAGAGSYVMMWQRGAACWVFLAGACLFASIQMMQMRGGASLTVRRLQRIQSLAGVCFVLAGILMVDAVHRLLLPLFSGSGGYLAYVEYVYNKWVVLLLIAALLEMYTTHRIGYEAGKETK